MPIVTVFYVLANLSYFVVIPPAEIIASPAVAVVGLLHNDLASNKIFSFSSGTSFVLDIRDQIVRLAEMDHSRFRFDIDIRQFERHHFRGRPNRCHRR